MSLVEQQIRNHHDIVAQHSQDQFCATSQRGDLEFDGTQGHLPNQSLLREKASGRGQTMSYRNPSTPLTNIRYPDSNSIVHSTNEDQSDSVPSGDDVARNDMQRVSPRPVSDTGKRNRLHVSDFIQSLSE
jgi:hypothetical protein